MDARPARDGAPGHRGGSPVSDPVSPELVLVSTPDAARWAREQLPDRFDDERVVAQDDVVRSPVAGRSAREEPFAPRLPHSRRRRASLLAVLLVAAPLVGVAIALLTSVLGSLLSSGTTERTGPRVPASVDQQPVAISRAQAGAPRSATSTVSGSSPVLRWGADPRARRYWVDLAKVVPGGERVILTLVTEETRLVVPVTWYDAGHRRRLVGGRYRWYVWPQYEPAAPGPRSKLLAHAEFIAG